MIANNFFIYCSQRWETSIGKNDKTFNCGGFYLSLSFDAKAIVCSLSERSGLLPLRRNAYNVAAYVT